jgi:Ni/Co efflux regulator RcnB
MIRRVTLVVTLLAATCFAGLVLEGSSVVPTSSAMTVGQNDNRDMDRRMNRRRHRRHERRWHRRHRRGRRNGNMNR